MTFKNSSIFKEMVTEAKNSYIYSTILVFQIALTLCLAVGKILDLDALA